MLELSEAEIITRLGFGSKPDLKIFIKGKTEQIEFAANIVISQFGDHINNWVKEYLKDKRKRFVARIEKPPENKVIKSPGRIAEKMITSYNLTPDTPITAQNFLIETGDVGRFRILCNYLSDVNFISDNIKKIDSHIQNIKHLDHKYKDYIKTPYEERRAGHRAIQHYFRCEKSELHFVFEVQIMTLFEHGWDKKDHHLIYENVRVGEGDKIPVPLKNRVAAMSELFYVADTTFDDLREEIEKLIGDK